jgi:hypothetical protein
MKSIQLLPNTPTRLPPASAAVAGDSADVRGGLQPPVLT